MVSRFQASTVLLGGGHAPKPPAGSLRDFARRSGILRQLPKPAPTTPPIARAPRTAWGASIVATCAFKPPSPLTPHWNPTRDKAICAIFSLPRLVVSIRPNIASPLLDCQRVTARAEMACAHRCDTPFLRYTIRRQLLRTPIGIATIRDSLMTFSRSCATASP